MSLILCQSGNFISEGGVAGLTEVSNFGPVVMAAGRFSGQQAFKFDNTGFGFKYLQRSFFGGNPNLIFGFSYYQGQSGGSWISGDANVFVLSDVTLLPLCTLRARYDGRMDLVTSSEVHELQTSLNFNVWHYIEVKYHTGGVVEVWIDDVLDTTAMSASTNDVALMRLGWSQLGTPYFLAGDLYILDPRTGFYTDRLGPVRIDAWAVTGDVLKHWATSGPIQHYACIDDANPGSAPDGDSTFIQAVGGAVDTYSITKQNGCRGRILALLLNVIAKGAIGGDLQTVWSPDPTSNAYVGIGAYNTPTAAYQFLQDIIVKNPNTNTYWTDGDIESALWGLSSLVGQTRVTMFWVEKVQSLRKVSYECGSLGSYAVKKN